MKQPNGLDKAKASIFKDITKRFDDVLTDADLPMVLIYVNAKRFYDLALADIETNGLTFKTEKGFLRRNPALTILVEQKDTLLRILNIFNKRKGIIVNEGPNKFDELEQL